MTPERLRMLGVNIITTGDVVSAPNAAQKAFQKIVKIGGVEVPVRVVLNRTGNMHSIHVRNK